jgi:hypothetical protein
LPMKVKHRRKVAVSKLIDTHSGAPLWYLRCVAMVNGLKEHDARRLDGGANESSEEPPS